jgi:AraC-like DNA-binding protein
MTFYQQEINRIKSICYSNKAQIETVVGTRHYINNHFDKALNLNLLSHIRFTSKFHLLRLFKRYYGLTPIQYRTDKRIEKAKEHLKQGMSVTNTCFDVGFECPSSFSTLFRSRVGLSPIQFQKKQFSQSRVNAEFTTLKH